VKYRPLLFVLACAAFLALPSLAGAAITTTNITTPASFIYPGYNADGVSDSFTVSGTADGNNGELLEIRCYYRNSGGAYYTLQSNVPVASGTFSTSVLLAETNAGEVCRLRAIPQALGQPEPVDMVTFTGPGISTNFYAKQLETGIQTGHYYFFGQQKGSYGSFGADDCGFESYLVDPNIASITTNVFDCAQKLSDDISIGSKSSLQIDGKNAIAAKWGEFFVFSPSYQQSISHFSIDPATGNASVTETQVLMACSTNVLPPPKEDCGDLVVLPVRLERTTTLSHDGLEAVVTDNYISTDGATHSLSVGYAEYPCFGIMGCQPGTYRFPGASAISAPTNESVPGPFPAGSTIKANAQTDVDGDKGAGRAAITMTPGADSAKFDGSNFFMLYWSNRTVPTTRSLQITARFNQAYTQSAVDALVADKSGDQVAPYPDFNPAPPPASKPASATIGKVGKASAKYDKKKKVVKIATGQRVSCPAGGGACTFSAKLSAKYKRGKKSKTYSQSTDSIIVPAGTTTPVVFTLKKNNPLYKPKGSEGSNPLYDIKQKFTGSITATAAGALPATSKFSIKLKLPKIPKK
jgi:hypothetical protein